MRRARAHACSGLTSRRCTAAGTRRRWWGTRAGRRGSPASQRPAGGRPRRRGARPSRFNPGGRARARVLRRVRAASVRRAGAGGYLMPAPRLAPVCRTPAGCLLGREPQGAAGERGAGGSSFSGLRRAAGGRGEQSGGIKRLQSTWIWRHTGGSGMLRTVRAGSRPGAAKKKLSAAPFVPRRNTPLACARSERLWPLLPLSKHRSTHALQPCCCSGRAGAGTAQQRGPRVRRCVADAAPLRAARRPALCPWCPPPAAHSLSSFQGADLCALLALSQSRPACDQKNARVAPRAAPRLPPAPLAAPGAPCRR